MSKEDWASMCQQSSTAFFTGSNNTLTFTIFGFTIAFFVLGSIFTGFWLNRWRCVKRSPNRELLLSAWRFTGVFLALSFMSCIFGVAAWILKCINVVFSQSYPNVVDDCPAYLRWLFVLGRTNISLSSHRFCYSIQFGCLFLSILLSLDRISGHALDAKTLSKQNPLLLRDGPSDPPRLNQKVASSQWRMGSKKQEDMLVPMNFYDSSSPVDDLRSSDPRPSSEFGKSRILPLVFKAGLAFVALLCLSSSVSVILAASYGAKSASDILRISSSDASCLNGTLTDARIEDQTEYEKQSISRFAGHLCEFCAAILVILLYVAVGYIGFAIVSAARKKLDASRAKLQQLQTTIGSQHEAKAAAAVSNALSDAMTTANAKLRRLAVFYCIVILVFIPRAAWAGFLTYASSEQISECGNPCDPCQPLPFIIDSWIYYRSEIPAVIDAFSCAMLSVVSVWFILTADEKRLLRTGRVDGAQLALNRGFGSTLESSLKRELKLSASLL